MVDVHTLEILPTVEELNEAVGRAFLARLRTLINEAGAGSRVDLAISGGAITTSLLPSLLPFVGEVDWSRVRVWLVDERYVASGDEDRNDDQAWGGLLPRCRRRGIRAYANLGCIRAWCRFSRRGDGSVCYHVARAHG